MQEFGSDVSMAVRFPLSNCVAPALLEEIEHNKAMSHVEQRVKFSFEKCPYMKDFRFTALYNNNIGYLM